ncbi:MAG TPA: hypothetical protein VMM60_09085, partial [Ilumatobacter sp.]|nr:hypothetical protein [Ilumatobacter sp.]
VDHLGLDGLHTRMGLVDGTLLVPVPSDTAIDDAPKLVKLSVIGVMFSDTAADGGARPTPALIPHVAGSCSEWYRTRVSGQNVH